MSISNQDKLKCIERELSYRRYVYPRRVAAKRMAAMKARDEIMIMEAIVEDYLKLAATEELPLFIQAGVA
jgi:hypothetical protein